MFLVTRAPNERFVVNDPLQGIRIEELFPWPHYLPHDLRFLPNYVTLASELTLLHRHELLATGISVRTFNHLQAQLIFAGLDFLPDDQSKYDALRNYYFVPSRAPLGLVFFNTLIPDKLARAGVPTLARLLEMESVDLEILFDELEMKPYRRKSLLPILHNVDINRIQTTLTRHGLYMKDAEPIWHG